MEAPPAAPSANARGAERGGGAPRNSSMSKLAMAKKAVSHALRLLDDADRFALVCYDEEVDVLVANAAASGGS